ncbi:hypothetical protein BDR04DRAFT_750431 [Suillus decipiens]|nr:hypothetical protein BDR04DRAFT_750431 [Suillus decipiens]
MVIEFEAILKLGGFLGIQRRAVKTLDLCTGQKSCGMSKNVTYQRHLASIVLLFMPRFYSLYL